MTERYETENKDIEVDGLKKEVNLYVTFKDFGNIYKTLTFKQVEDIYKEIHSE